jgi:hypothetical protein
MNLQRDQEPIDGNWWDPARPEDKWHGTLKLTAGKPAELRVLDYGRSLLQSSFGSPGEVATLLHGTSSAGKPITLYNSFCQEHRMTEISEERRFQVEQSIFGRHLREEDLVFDEVHVEFDYLNDWVAYRRYEEKEVEEQEGRKEIRIRLNPDHKFPFEAPGYSAAQFYLGYRSQSSLFQFSIENLSNLQITFSERLPLRDIFRDLTQWRWFLNLATGRDVHLKRLTLFRSDLKLAVGEDSFAEPLEIWASSRGKREDKNLLHPSEMIFSLPDIRPSLSEIITNWKTMQKSWAVVLHRYFATIHREELRLEEQFLFRTQAIEALSRVQSEGKDLSVREAYSHAWDQAPHELREKLGQKEAFVRSVGANRNFLVHYRPQDEDQVAEFPQLFELSQKLKFILEVAVLRELRVPPSVLERALNGSRWQHVVMAK